MSELVDIVAEVGTNPAEVDVTVGLGDTIQVSFAECTSNTSAVGRAVRDAGFVPVNMTKQMSSIAICARILEQL